MCLETEILNLCEISLSAIDKNNYLGDISIFIYKILLYQLDFKIMYVEYM